MTYSVKPGRGPSLMGAVGGVVSIFALLIILSLIAKSGAPKEFLMFGGLMLVMAVIGVIYNLVNATTKNRMSHLDITTPDEESDLIARAMGHDQSRKKSSDWRVTQERKIPENENKPKRKFEGGFCPFCGQPLEENFDFCPGCGKDI